MSFGASDGDDTVGIEMGKALSKYEPLPWLPKNRIDGLFWAARVHLSWLTLDWLKQRKR